MAGASAGHGLSISFIGLQLYRNESELIPIRGFVPPQFCTVSSSNRANFAR